jgi:hypothetical protein
MNHELICSWLELSPEEGWPPDHYRLLGLEPGEDRTDRIEQRIHECLDTVRRYQMTYPEQATEAMNRLAQAFVCLTEPAAKQVYDASLLGKAACTATVEPEALRETPGPQDPLSWLYNPATLGEIGPPPVRRMFASLPTPPTAEVPADGEAETVEAETLDMGLEAETFTPATEPPPVRGVSLPEEEPAPPPDPISEAACCPAACRGLRSKRGLYHRIARTRQLLRLWQHVGRYLADPTRRLTRSSELRDLDEHLGEIVEALEDFPPVLGRAGQPGYLVATLEDMELKPTFQKLTPDQREGLSRDWEAGLQLLKVHRDLLRKKAQTLKDRRRTPLVRAVRLLLRKPLVTVIVLAALIALNVAVWRTYGPGSWSAVGGNSRIICAPVTTCTARPRRRNLYRARSFPR